MFRCTYDETLSDAMQSSHIDRFAKQQHAVVPEVPQCDEISVGLDAHAFKAPSASFVDQVSQPPNHQLEHKAGNKAYRLIARLLNRGQVVLRRATSVHSHSHSKEPMRVMLMHVRVMLED